MDLSLLITLLVVALFSLGIGVALWLKNPVRGARFFALMMFSDALGLAAYAFSGESIFNLDVWDRLAISGFILNALLFFWFALYYSAYDRYLAWWLRGLIILEPIAMLMFVWTAPAAQVFSGESLSLWVRLDSVFGSFLYATAVILLWRRYLLGKVGLTGQNNQRSIVAAASLLPLFFILIGINSETVNTQLVVMLFAFFPMGVLITWALLRREADGLVPIARDVIIDSLEDIILVVDSDERIIDINPAACQLFGFDCAKVLGRETEDVFADYPHLIEQFGRAEGDGRVEYTFDVEADGQRHYFDVRTKTLFDETGKVAGRFFSARDITDRKQAELAQKEASVQREAVLDAIPDLMFIMDKDGIYQDHHLPADRPLAEPLIGKHVSEPAFISEALGERIETAIKNTLSDGQMRQFTYRLDVPYEDTVYETRFSKLDETRVLRLVRDVTEAHENRKQLKRLASIPEQNPHPFVELSLQGEVAYVNEEAKMRFPDLEPQGKAHPFFANLASSQETLNQRSSWQREISLEEGVFEQNIWLDLERGILRIYAYDISKRKANEQKVQESEARYRHFVESAQDAIYRVDAEARFSFVNPMVETLIGFTQEDMLGRHYLDFIRADYRERALEFYIQQRREGHQNSYYEFPVIHKDGREIWLGQNVQPVIEDGVLMGFQAVARDISERRRAENELLQQREALEAANAELDRYASIAAHDLQAPLRKIKSFSERVLSHHTEEMDDTGKLYLERIQASSDQMQTLIRDVLSAAKSVTRVDSTSLHREVIDLTVLAQDVATDLLASRTDAPQIDIQTLPSLEANPTQMRQVLQNLMGNGLKYQPEGQQPKLKLWSESHGSNITLFVRDNGIGFDERHLERLFTLYQRLPGHEHYDGTGIGLATVRQIVEQHGGSITAQSQLGQGATFIISFPLGQAFDDQTDRLEEAAA